MAAVSDITSPLVQRYRKTDGPTVRTNTSHVSCESAGVAGPPTSVNLTVNSRLQTGVVGIIYLGEHLSQNSYRITDRAKEWTRIFLKKSPAR